MARKRSKKYDRAREAVQGDDAPFGPEEAFRRVKEFSFADFDETVEVAVRLGVDPKQADQVVRGTVVLPAGTGQDVEVLVFAEGPAASEAEEAGAEFVGPEYVDEVEDGWVDFDVAIAHPSMMDRVAPLGRILGPRGLMPTPKAGTVTEDVGEAVDEAKAGKIEFRVDRGGNLHVPLGRVSFEVGELVENFEALMAAVTAQRPASAEGAFVRSITVSSTMGPGVEIDPGPYRLHSS